MNVFKRMKRFFASLIYNDQLHDSLREAEKKLAKHHDNDEDIAEFRDAVIHYIKYCNEKDGKAIAESELVRLARYIDSNSILYYDTSLMIWQACDE